MYHIGSTLAVSFTSHCRLTLVFLAYFASVEVENACETVEQNGLYVSEMPLYFPLMLVMIRIAVKSISYL